MRSPFRLRGSRSVAASLMMIVIFGLFWLAFQNNPTYVLLGTTIAAYTIMGQGLSLQYGTGGQLSVAQGTVGGIGAYACTIGLLRYGLPLELALVVGMVAGGVLGSVLGILNWRISGHHFVIVTFAVAVLGVVLFTNLGGLTGGSSGLVLAGHEPDSTVVYVIAAALVVVTTGLLAGLRASSFGFRLKASAISEDLAATLGIRVRRERSIAFVIAGALGGIGGSVYALALTYIQPQAFTFTFGITIILVVLIGGPESEFGALVGAGILVLFPQVVTLSPSATEVVYGVLVVTIILVLPSGVVGTIGSLARGRVRLPRSDGKECDGLSGPNGERPVMDEEAVIG